MMTAIELKSNAMSYKTNSRAEGLRLCSVCEAGWFLISLILFIVLGPFAAPVALIAVFSCQGREELQELAEPEAMEQV